MAPNADTWPDFDRAGVKADSVIGPEWHLQRSTTQFWCPYCYQSWLRGGHKEGFVKSAATNHVALCFEICVFEKGYMLYGHGRAMTFARYRKLPAMAQRRFARIKAAIRARKRQGLTPRAPK